ncbi:MAG TPA: helix-turn-helix transcriptional regulator [Bacillota bacterium]|nr:helix-turn-helix transcriptional regulator [Bacillota bacterium]
MSSDSSLPWVKTNDFLVEVGAAENIVDFFHRVTHNINRLIPIDLYCVLGVVDPEGKLCESKSVVESEKWFNYFKNYYWSRFPDISQEPGVNTKNVDWNRYLGTEYATDFMAPQYIRYSLGVQSLGNPQGFSGILALNRTKNSPQFTDREQQIMEFLQPHLSNFFRFLTLPNSKEGAGAPAVQPTPLEKLTKRENEIAGLLCRGLSTREICALLGITENTAYRHLNNIFAKLDVASRTELVAKLKFPALLNVY